jgi:Zn-dependent M28 family amino/carboxypeptidase
VFLAVTAEEKGLLGSEYYAANPLYPLGKTVGVLNTDVDGRARPGARLLIRGNQKLGLLDMLVEEGAKRGRRYLHARSAPGNRRLLPLRPFPLAKVGVPAMSFGRGRTWSTAASRAARRWSRNYTAKRYHQPTTNIAELGLHRHGRRTPSCSTRSACASPIRATGPTGARTANSAPSAASVAAPPASPRPKRPPKKGERG